jgi:rare lipoprotein A
MKKWMIGIAIFQGMMCSAGEAQSWYGSASFSNLKGRTASGKGVGSFTAAHRSLPFGTKVRVTNLSNQRSVIVTITDRGPYAGGRVIDVSKQAAEVLGFRPKGIARVHVETMIN